MPIAAMKLVDGLPLWVKTGKFTATDALFCVVQLMGDVNSLLVCHPLKLSDGHLHRTFWFKLIFHQCSCIAPHWHILHHCPEVQGVGIIPQIFSHSLAFWPFSASLIFILPASW